MRNWLPVLFLLACGGEAELDLRYEAAGAYPVGNTTIVVVDSARSRTLTVELWYPAAESARAAAAAGAPVESFVVGSDERDQYRELLSSAPSGCPSTATRSARDAEVAAAGSWPLLVFSHCHNCVRFSSFSVAERLASHGFVVAAPGHIGNTLFDDLAGEGVELGAEFLSVRGADISFVLDVLLDPAATVVPEALRGALDSERVGVFGHSYGAVTTGLVLQDDARPRAGLAIASPMDNPLIGGVAIAEIDDPVGFIVAIEDNSITEIGNMFIRRNFEDVAAPAWKAEVSDAGHWSFSDICGLHEQFAAGCGQGERQTDLTEFTYLPVTTGIAVAQAYATAFFSAHLLDDGKAVRYLAEARPSELVFIEQRDGDGANLRNKRRE